MTSSTGGYNKALQANTHGDTFKLDGRNTRALLAHVLRLAKHIPFFEAGNLPSGTWADVLGKDALPALALFLENADKQPNRPARVAELARSLHTQPPDASESMETETDTLVRALLQEEVDWQNASLAALKQAGLSFELAPIASQPKPHKPAAERAGFYAGMAAQLSLRRTALQQECQSRFANLLNKPDGRLHPHSGLLLAFLHQYAHVQERLNRLVPVHAADFYARLAGLRPSPARPDRVLVALLPEKETAPCILPAGAEVRGENAPTFLTEKETPVNGARLAAVRASTPLSPPGPWLHVQTMEKPGHAKARDMWLPFPEKPSNAALHACPTLLALPIFHLEGGKRHINLRFPLYAEAFGPEATARLQHAWAKHASDASPLFAVEASGPEGWFPAAKATLELRFPIATAAPEGESSSPGAHEAKAPGATPELLLSITLTPEQPGLVAPEEEVHSLQAKYPSLRLVPSLPQSPLWEALNAFQTPKVHAAVAVSGLRQFNLTVNGQSLPLAPGAPVEVFGPMPKADAFVEVEAPEWEGKRLSTLRLHWKWNAPESFEDYFAVYPFSGIRLARFWKMTAESAPAFAGNPIPLEGGTLSALHCPLPPEGRLKAYRLQVEGEGSLFGHGDYPALLAQLTLKEASLLRRLWATLTSGPRLKNLRPPFVPLWSDITLEYKAEEDFALTKPEYFAQLGPLPYPGATCPPKLFAHQANHALHLELEGLEEQPQKLPLSVYVRVQNLNAASEVAQPPAMHLCGALAMEDESRLLQESGILHLLLDAAQEADGRRQLSFHWTKRPAFALQAVLLHAAWATARMEATEADGNRPFPLPAGMLSAVAFPNSTAMPATQPFPSVGGRPAKKAESTAFMQESAEYLSHRNQAIVPRDYERLVLREFPEVVAVRCLPHSGPKLEGKTPGAVALVVFAPPEGARMHAPKASFTLDARLPAYADAALLDAIKSHVQALASPFVRLTVMQPRYEALHIALRGKLRPSKDLKEAIAEMRQAVSALVAPWAFFPEKTLFGASLHADVFLQTLQTLPWLASLSECVVKGPGRAPLVMLQDEAKAEAVLSCLTPAGLFLPESIEVEFERQP